MQSLIVMEKHGHGTIMVMGGAAVYIKVHQPDAWAVRHNVEGGCLFVRENASMCERGG